MKLVLLFVLLMTSVGFAGNGGGTMSPTMNGRVAMNRGGIVYYQGQKDGDVYFQHGRPSGNTWKLEQRKIQVEPGLTSEHPVVDALMRSKENGSWAKVRLTAESSK